MGPHASPRNSTCLLLEASRADRKTARGVLPMRAGAFFAGRRHDRFAVGQEPGGKVYGPSGSELIGRRCLARRRTEELPAAGEALCSVRPFDWEGLSSVPSDRGRSRVRVPLVGLEGPWLLGRHLIRPVLKHGPRSLTCARVMGLYEI